MSYGRQWCVSFFVIVAGFALLAHSAFAQPAATLAVEDVSAAPGAAVPVTVSAENVLEKIVGIQGQFTFDPAIMQVTRLRFVEAFQCDACVVAYNVQSDSGVVRFVATLVMTDEAPIGLEDTVLFTIDATAVGNSGDSTPIDITFAFVKNMAHQVLVVDERDGSLTIVGQNLPPIADFSHAPANPQVMQPITFSEACSDPDGRIVKWSWAFGDGQTLDVQTASQPVSHSYNEGNTYNVTLTCTDNGGQTGLITKPVRVGPETGGPEIYVFPNPCRSICTFHYKFPEGTGDAALRLFNVRGELVYSVSLNTNTNQLRWNMQGDFDRPLPNGPYFFFATVTTSSGILRTALAVLVIER